MTKIEQKFKSDVIVTDVCLHRFCRHGVILIMTEVNTMCGQRVRRSWLDMCASWIGQGASWIGQGASWIGQGASWSPVGRSASLIAQGASGSPVGRSASPGRLPDESRVQSAVDAATAVVNVVSHPRHVQAVTDLGKWLARAKCRCFSPGVTSARLGRHEDGHCPAAARPTVHGSAQRAPRASSPSHPVMTSQ